MDARVLIYTETALGRGRMVSPTIGHPYPRRQNSGTSLDTKEGRKIPTLPTPGIEPIRLYGVNGRIPTFQPSDIGDFNLYPGTLCMPFICVLSCVFSGGGPDILLTTYSGRPVLVLLCSVLMHIAWLPYRSLTNGHLDSKSLGV